MKDLTRKVHRLDLTHAGPVRIRPLRARNSRTFFERISTPIEIREVDPTGPTPFGTVDIFPRRARDKLFAFEGATWAPLLDSRHDAPVAPDDFLAYLRGDDVTIGTSGPPRYLAWTPINAWRQSVEGSRRYLGDPDGAPPASTILDDARDEARANAASFAARNILICQGRVLVRAKGPFVEFHTDYAGRDHYQETLFPNPLVGGNTTLDALVAPDSVNLHASLVRKRRLREEGGRPSPRKDGDPVVKGPRTRLDALPGANPSSDVLALATSWGILHTLRNVDYAISHLGIQAEDARTLRGHAAEVAGRWAMRASICAIPRHENVEALQSVLSLTEAVLRRLPPPGVPPVSSQTSTRNHLALQAEWLAADLLPRAGAEARPEDTDALLSLVP